MILSSVAGVLFATMPGCAAENDSPVNGSSTNNTSEIQPVEPTASAPEAFHSAKLILIGGTDNQIIHYLVGKSSPLSGHALASEAFRQADAISKDDLSRWTSASDLLLPQLDRVYAIVCNLAEIAISELDRLLVNTALMTDVPVVLVNVSSDKMAALTGSAGADADLVVLRRKSTEGGFEMRLWGSGNNEVLGEEDFARVTTELRSALEPASD